MVEQQVRKTSVASEETRRDDLSSEAEDARKGQRSKGRYNMRKYTHVQQARRWAVTIALHMDRAHILSRERTCLKY